MGFWKRKKDKTKEAMGAATVSSSRIGSNHVDSSLTLVVLEQQKELCSSTRAITPLQDDKPKTTVSNNVSLGAATNNINQDTDVLVQIGEYHGIMLYFLPHIDGSHKKIFFGIPIQNTPNNSTTRNISQNNAENAFNPNNNSKEIQHEGCIELIHPDSYVPTTILFTNTTSKSPPITSTNSTNTITTNEKQGEKNNNFEHLIPDDQLNQAIFYSSLWIAKHIVRLSEEGAKLLKDHGEKWRSSQPASAVVFVIEEEKEEKQQQKQPNQEQQGIPYEEPSNIHVRNASYVWSFSKAVRNIVEYVSESISNVLGTMIGTCITEQPTDGEILRYSRQLVRTTVLSCGEVGTSVEESFDIITHATKEEVTSCVALYYGRDAAAFTQHTLGTTINLLKAVITARRVLNAKKVAQFSIARASTVAPAEK